MCIGRRCCHSHTVVMCIAKQRTRHNRHTTRWSMCRCGIWKHGNDAHTHFLYARLLLWPPLLLHPFINDDDVARMYQIRFFTISFQFITHDMTHWAEISYLKTENLPHRIASHRIALTSKHGNWSNAVIIIAQKWNTSRMTALYRPIQISDTAKIVYFHFFSPF